MLDDYLEHGWRVFPLWPIQADGACGCDDTRCEQAGKHPRISNWSSVPHWSVEQIEAMREHQALGDHFGVVVEQALVVDIDPRNGGDDSYWRLVKDLGGDDLAMSAGLVVETGGGGRHIYYRLPDDGAAYVQHLTDYLGIDFKTSGFVVGAGSLHASGGRYEGHGDLELLTSAPSSLLELIRRPDMHRAEHQGTTVDVSDDDIATMLGYIDNTGEGVHYEDWIRVGMAIHHATNGSGYELWRAWSAKSKKHDERLMDKRWHSFGKSANPVTIGTLMHYAQQGGYRPPVVLPEPEEPSEATNDPFNTDHIDLLRPPGLIGEVAQWINSQCRYPRERLAVVAALTAVGNIAGLRYTDDKDRATLNLLSLCVAGSATGKEAVLQSVSALHEAVGVQRAVAGSIKSEQEIIRNLVRHQAAYYLVDEVGYLLQKVESARQKGGAAYLDGIIATIMAAYSKADGNFLVTGDLKEEIRKELNRELAHCRQRIEDNEDPNGWYESQAERITNERLPEIETGIQSPFLSMMGMTTPVSFESLMTVEQATNGFIGRCLLIQEPETNPPRKRGWRRPPREVPESIRMTLCRLYDGGEFDALDTSMRVERRGDRAEVSTTDEAWEMLEDAADWLEAHAENQKGETGLEAIVRRSYEHLTKVSTILALGEGVRRPDHVRWAFKLVREDLTNKLALTTANTREGTDEALRVRVLEAAGEGEYMGTIRKRVARCKAYSGADADRMVNYLVERGELGSEERKNPTNGKPCWVYWSA